MPARARRKTVASPCRMWQGKYTKGLDGTDVVYTKHRLIPRTDMLNLPVTLEVKEGALSVRRVMGRTHLERHRCGAPLDPHRQNHTGAPVAPSIPPLAAHPHAGPAPLQALHPTHTRTTRLRRPREPVTDMCVSVCGVYVCVKERVCKRLRGTRREAKRCRGR